MLLVGCSGKNTDMDRALALRSKLFSQAVSFDAEITADYGSSAVSFVLGCSLDSSGTLVFSVKEPKTLSGIAGNISAKGGKLTFDDKAVAFELLADGEVSPISGPWILMQTLRSGYLTSCAKEGQYLRLSIDDSYEDDALHLDIWLNDADAPVRAEIIWQGRRILSMSVSNFTFV